MSLSGLLGLGTRELVAIVGAGGKSTLMAALGAELAAAGRMVLVTTTTKMGTDQTDRYPTVVWTDEDVAAVLDRPGPILVLERGDESKVTGPTPDVVDALFGTADYVLVEADGARGRSFKAPAEHEPVIPAATTFVVIVVGSDAFGRPIAEAAHRPERVVAISGRETSAAITPAVVASVIGHHDGGLRGVPATARVAVAVTKVANETDRALVRDLAARLEHHPQIDRVVPIEALPQTSPSNRS